MRDKFFYIIFSVSILLGNIASTLAKTPYYRVLSCKMASGDKVVLKILHPIDGDKPYLEINGKTSLAFDKDETYGVVTELLQTQCIQHTLIFTIDIGSPYPRGFAIRQNPETHQYERIYFAEKALPHWLYLKNNDWGIIIPNIGYETDKKYLVYTYKKEKNQPELQEKMTPMDTFPVPKKRLIHIPVPKE